MHLVSTTTATKSSSASSTRSPTLTPRPDFAERWIRSESPIPFEEARSQVLELDARDGVKRDIIVSDLRGWTFGALGSSMALAPIPCAGGELDAPLGLRELAFKQLAARIEAPPTYLRRLPEKLLTANVNFGLSTCRDSAMLRVAGSEVRAVLSDRYAVLDTPLLLELVSDALRRNGLHADAMVRAVAVGTSTVLRVTVPSGAVNVRRGDALEYGLDISTSDLGVRAIGVTPLTFRLICENGLRAWQSESTSRFRHVGAPHRVHDLLRDAIPLALAEARGDIERWRRSVECLIDDAHSEVEQLRSIGITGSDARSVARAIAIVIGRPADGKSDEEIAELLRGQRAMVFDVANAITSIAQTRSVSTRLALEEAGHRYLVSRTR